MARTRNDNVSPRIGATARALCNAPGHPQEPLAEAVDLQPGAISRFENGAMGLLITTLVDVADAVGVPLTRFFDTGTDQPTADPDEISLLDKWRSLLQTPPHPHPRRAPLRLPRRRAPPPSPLPKPSHYALDDGKAGSRAGRVPPVPTTPHATLRRHPHVRYPQPLHGAIR